EAVVDRRTEAELRARAQLEHRLREDVRQAVPDSMELFVVLVVLGHFAAHFSTQISVQSIGQVPRDRVESDVLLGAGIAVADRDVPRRLRVAVDADAERRPGFVHARVALPDGLLRVVLTDVFLPEL